MSGLRTLDDLDVDRASASWCGSTSTCPCRTARSPTRRRIERSVPTVKELVEQGRQGRRPGAFRPAQGQARELDVAAPARARRWARRWAARRWPSPRTASASPPSARSPRSSRAGSLLLENLRFHPGEEKNDPAFAERSPASASSTSTTPSPPRTGRTPRPRACARLLPAYAGRADAGGARGAGRERSGNPSGRWSAWSAAPRSRPSSSCCGNLIDRVDMLVIGGGMANTFLHAAGHRRRQARCASSDMAETAREIMAEAARREAARWCCRSTWWWRASSRPDAVAASCRSIRCRPTTDDPRHRACDAWRAIEALDRALQDPGLERPARRLRDRRPSIPARSRSPGASPSCTRAGKLISVAGGGDTRGGARRTPACSTSSPTSRPPAAPSWNGSKARSCPGVAALRRR